MSALPAGGNPVTVADERISAIAPGRSFGLYDAQAFRLATGDCRDCASQRQALWYFERETIAVPLPGSQVASWTPGVRAADDVRAWAAARSPDAPLDYPPLVWVAAPQVAAGARLTPDATALTFGARPSVPFRLTPKLPLNRSYFDGSSGQFFAQRTIKVRGTLTPDGIVARTLWPEDFRLDPAPPRQALAAGETTVDALRALVRAEPQGGAQSPFAAHTLWQRHPTAAGPAFPPGRAVIGFMVNGAQGDDDEAHGGHFALVTGRTRADGAIGDWLVNNFYSLDVESEKGILAAPLPLDNYLADLNSGQGWYRPSYLIVAALADDRAAVLLQSALNRAYNQFYRHQLVYRHATMNCAGISVDVLRALGWDVPVRGPTNRLLAAVAFPYFLATERPLAKAKTAFDYLWEDQTRLMPAAAFEEAGASLLALAGAGGADARRDAGRAGSGPLARMLAEDVDAVAFLRFPQLPSSRAFGAAPAVTTWEYRALVPSDPGEAQIVAVPPRPFPAELRDPDLLPLPRRPSDVAAMAWAALATAAAAWLLWRWW